MIIVGSLFMCVPAMPKPVTDDSLTLLKEIIMTLHLMQTSSEVPFAEQEEPSAPLRYYAQLCSPFAHEPTRDRVEVVGTDGKGEGLRAVISFKQGEIVFNFYGALVREQTLYTLQLSPGCYISDPLVMGKVLHSCDPNMSCDMSTQTFTARRAIMTGEFLTMDYESTEDELYRAFFCGCGALKCRGFIHGRQGKS
jgi:tyrocidine synthetase-3